MNINYSQHINYEHLPESIKALYSSKEYAWLGDEERNRLEERECYPEPEEDD